MVDENQGPETPTPLSDEERARLDDLRARESLGPKLQKEHDALAKRAVAEAETDAEEIAAAAVPVAVAAVEEGKGVVGAAEAALDAAEPVGAKLATEFGAELWGALKTWIRTEAELVHQGHSPQTRDKLNP